MLISTLGAYPSYYIANEGFVALKALCKPWKTLPLKGAPNCPLGFIDLQEIAEIGILRFLFKSETQATSSANTPLHFGAEQLLSKYANRQWIESLYEAKKIEAELFDAGIGEGGGDGRGETNNAYGMLKNAVNMFIQTL